MIVFSLACAWSLVGDDVAEALRGLGVRVPSLLVASAPKALALGMVLALVGWVAWHAAIRRVSRVLIQVCVVLLGLRMNWSELAHAAASGIGFAVGTIAFALVLGMVLARLLKTGREVGLLVSSGTAICGGSAIAAVGASIGAGSSAMAVATGAIFLLNAAGLYILPLMGHALGLTEAQFGTWAGVALHDIASVAGAGKTYHLDGSTGSVALDTAMVVKLTRVLWIFPIALVAGWWVRRAKSDAGGTGHASAKPHRGAPFPWFIVGFLGASALRTIVPATSAIVPTVNIVSASGFQLALLLIGAGLSRRALAAVGWRAFVQALVLWIALAAAALAVVKTMPA
jgi:uncharacterized membrane protein YadS